MKLIDGDRIITVQLYDDEHEEFTEKKMSIIDCINAYTDEGVTEADVVEQTDVPDINDGDLISRQAAIDSLDNVSANYTGKGQREWHPHIDFMIDAINKVPSVEPERKTGKWIEGEKTPGYIKWSCSECGMLCRNPQKPWYKFCPSCGAKMEVDG